MCAQSIEKNYVQSQLLWNFCMSASITIRSICFFFQCSRTSWRLLLFVHDTDQLERDECFPPIPAILYKNALALSIFSVTLKLCWAPSRVDLEKPLKSVWHDTCVCIYVPCTCWNHKENTQQFTRHRKKKPKFFFSFVRKTIASVSGSVQRIRKGWKLCTDQISTKHIPRDSSFVRLCVGIK